MDNIEICSNKQIDQIKVNRVCSNLSDPQITESLASIFKALSDPTRLRIVQTLIIEELCVCDISTAVEVSLSAISHQLRLLRTMRIVKNRKDGKMVYYSLDDDHIRTLVELALEHVEEKTDS